MGTNYYRIITEDEIEKKRARLIQEISEMDLSPGSIEREFEDSWKTKSPWTKFIEGNSVHLGKRSSGWKFCWNFHDNKYYNSKKELAQFVLGGRVVNEYGEEIDPQEFLDMAFSWGEPNGLVVDAEYFNKTKNHAWFSNPADYYDRIIDGLRVSSSVSFS